MTSLLDDIAPSFKTAANRWPDAPNIQAHYVDLASTFESNGSSLIELCKSFLEMVCITIVTELGKELPPSSNVTTTEYLGSALDALDIRNQRGSSDLGLIISGYNKLIKGLNNYRNQEGSVAHGRDGFIDCISERHARVYLLSADAIIAMLLLAYDGVEPSFLKTRDPHNRFTHHNKKIDANTQVEVQVDDDGIVGLAFRAGTLEEGFEIRVSPSELLYCLDRRAYVEILQALRGIGTQPLDEEIPIETTILDHKEPLAWKPQPVTNYKGKYAEQVSPLTDFIFQDIMKGELKYVSQIQNLTFTILNGMDDLAVVDWSKRPSTKAEVRLLLKKLGKMSSIDEINNRSIERIIEWLEKNIPGGEA